MDQSINIHHSIKEEIKEELITEDHFYDTIPYLAGNLNNNGVIKGEMKNTIGKTCSDDIPFVECKMEPDSDINIANSPDIQMNECKKEKLDDFVQNVASIHERMSNLECKLCNYRTNKKYKFTLHVKSIHEGIKFDCNLCDYKANRKEKLTQHVKYIHEGITFDCNMCDFKASRKDRLTRHAKSIHEGITFDCKVCDYKANNKNNLTRHVKSIHGEDFRYYCQLCDYKTKNKSNLNQHVKSIHGEITYDCRQCELCDFKTSKEDKLALSTLQYHVKTVHKGAQ